MSESNLEQVKKLAEQLSPEDRLQLWDFLASIPDGNIHNLNDPPILLDDAKHQEGLTVEKDEYELLYTPSSAAIIQRGRVIFRIFFDIK
jgi:hypothetical protein